MAESLKVLGSRYNLLSVGDTVAMFEPTIHSTLSRQFIEALQSFSVNRDEAALDKMASIVKIAERRFGSLAVIKVTSLTLKHIEKLKNHKRLKKRMHSIFYLHAHAARLIPDALDRAEREHVAARRKAET